MHDEGAKDRCPLEGIRVGLPVEYIGIWGNVIVLSVHLKIPNSLVSGGSQMSGWYTPVRMIFQIFVELG
jgi:hypothetical protein